MKYFKRKITFLSILLTLTTIQLSFGQENENARSKFGLGVTLFNLAEYSYDYDSEASNSIYMTFDLSDNFRLEPIVGFAISDGLEQYSIGIGAFGKKPLSKFNVLYGLRIGLNSSETISIAPTIGGEYFFIKNFSIGSEVQLRGLFNDGLTLMTNSSVIVRFYF